MNRSKAKGTAWTTAIVNYLKPWFPHAEARVQHGAKDMGDIINVPGWVIEAKNCKTFNLAGWLGEAKQEAVNAGVGWYAVWFKRRGTTDPGRSYVLLDGETFVRLLGEK